MDKKIEVLSTTRIKYSSDLYKIVDSLNRTLKEQDLMFGLALDEKIKKQLYLRFTERSDTMKKWIFAIIIVIVASGIYGAYVYNKAMGKKIPKESKFVEIAKEKAKLTKVKSVDYYNGKSAYIVVQGTDEKENNLSFGCLRKRGYCSKEKERRYF